MRKIILSNSTMNSGNRGCVALSISTMYILQQILEEKNEDYEFFLPQSGFAKKDYGKHSFHCADIHFDYSAIPNPSFFSRSNFLACITSYKDFEYSKKIYKTADVILDIGQGDSFSDIYGKRRFDTIYSQYELGMKYNIRYCILPQTIGPFDDPNMLKRAVKGLKYADVVFARDKQSYNFVKSECKDVKVVESIDVAFFMPYNKMSFDAEKTHVGLNVSALLWNGGYTKNNQFGLQLDYQDLIRRIISYFIEKKNVVLHLVPHVVYSERTLENDYAVCSDLSREYNDSRLVLAPLFLDPIEAKGYIAGMNFFIGSRMHSTIAAFSSCVPVCPMAYSRKFNGLFQDTLDYPYMVDLKQEDILSAMRIIDDSYETLEHLREVEQIKMNTIIVEKYACLKETIADFLRL